MQALDGDGQSINEHEPTQHLHGLQSLAPELVGRVLQIAIEDLEDHERQMLLCSASLVCKTWSSEAQLLLWKRIVILNETQARQLLSSPSLGQYKTEVLSIVPKERDRLMGFLAGAVCANVVGIVNLELAFFFGENRLEGTVLGLPSLKGVKDSWM